MPLAALIAAQDHVESGDGLRATLPLAGRTLVEYQARLAIMAGATRIILLVERVPAALARGIDRLRQDGITIEAARSVSDAADRFHPEDRILLIADGCVADQHAVNRLVRDQAPALLALPDTTEHGMFERIDPESRWAGFALISGTSLHDTSRMLGDWDLTSTQLRRSVQEGAARIDALAPGPDGEPANRPVIAIGTASLAALERRVLRPKPGPGGEWVDRYLHQLIAAPLTGPLIARRVQPFHVALGSIAVAWIGAIGAIFGYFWVAAICLPIATAAFGVARQMARIWAPDLPEARPIVMARYAAALVVLAMLASHLARDGGWGWWLVAAIVPLGLTGLAALRPIARAVGSDDAAPWLPVGDALIWIVPVLAILAGWSWMLLSIAAYCAVGFAWRLRQLRRDAVAKA